MRRTPRSCACLTGVGFGLILAAVCTFVPNALADAEVEDTPVDLTQPTQGDCPRTQVSTARGCVAPPVALRRVQARYPKPALKAHANGSVMLHATINVDGTAHNIFVFASTTPDMGFEEAAIGAVRQWHFRPAFIGRNSVRAIWTLVVEFSNDGRRMTGASGGRTR
jgi:TonB family protein